MTTTKENASRAVKIRWARISKEDRSKIMKLCRAKKSYKKIAKKIKKEI